MRGLELLDLQPARNQAIQLRREERKVDGEVLATADR
jgi:hypothetical protein